MFQRNVSKELVGYNIIRNIEKNFNGSFFKGIPYPHRVVFVSAIRAI